MEILISANEKILSMAQNPVLDISENMTEEQYLQWLQMIGSGDDNDGHRIQEISV